MEVLGKFSQEQGEGLISRPQVNVCDGKHPLIQSVSLQRYMTSRPVSKELLILRSSMQQFKEGPCFPLSAVQ